MDKAKAYGFSPETRSCKKCGASFTTTEWFETGEWVGMQAPLHDCGERYRLKVMVPKSLAKREENKRLYRAILGQLKAEADAGREGEDG